MMARRAFSTAVLVSAALALGGCSQSESIPATQCWNSKLLRVEIGGTLFDFPRKINVFSRSYAKIPGIKRVRSKDVLGKADHIFECQDKQHVPLKYGNDAGYSFIPSYGSVSQLLGDIGKSDPKSPNPVYRDYLADVGDVGKIRFVRSARKVIPGQRVEHKDFVFEYDGRTHEMTCQILNESELGEVNPRAPFPLLCAPGVPFRMGDLIITIQEPNMVWDSAQQRYLRAPPERWPDQWQAAINEIASYRVKSSGVEQR